MRHSDGWTLKTLHRYYVDLLAERDERHREMFVTRDIQIKHLEEQIDKLNAYSSEAFGKSVALGYIAGGLAVLISLVSLFIGWAK